MLPGIPVFSSAYFFCGNWLSLVPYVSGGAANHGALPPATCGHVIQAVPIILLPLLPHSSDDSSVRLAEGPPKVRLPPASFDCIEMKIAGHPLTNHTVPLCALPLWSPGKIWLLLFLLPSGMWHLSNALMDSHPWSWCT